MKTESITRLLSALGPPSASSQSSKATALQTYGRVSAGSSDAVTLGKGFRPKTGIEAESQARQEKVALLREQVQSGKYKSGSEQVAVAVIKDLGI